MKQLITACYLLAGAWAVAPTNNVGIDTANPRYNCIAKALFTFRQLKTSCAFYPD